jgi:hypothetical protein
VQGTDPECTLLLTIEDDKTWQYALARQTSYGLQAVLDEAVVWERLPVWMSNPGKTYAVLKE